MRPIIIIIIRYAMQKSTKIKLEWTLLLLLWFFIPQVVKIPGVKNYKSYQNVGWSEVQQVNWQSVVQKHGVEAL